MMDQVVWTNGCFDILHMGHLALLDRCIIEAKQLPHGRVIVGIDGDARVRELKGANRPVQNEQTRAAILSHMEWISKVIIFNSANELSDILRRLSPSILIVGEEYRSQVVIGGEFAKQILYFPKIEGCSTTAILEKIRE